MLRKADRIESALLQAKADFEFHCLFTATHKNDLASAGIELDGSHIFEKSTYPNLRCVVENIIPVNRVMHSDRRVNCLDYIRYREASGAWISRNRKPLERIQFIMTHCHGDYRQRVRERLSVLFTGILEEIRDPELVSIVKDGWGLLEGR